MTLVFGILGAKFGSTLKYSATLANLHIAIAKGEMLYAFGILKNTPEGHI